MFALLPRIKRNVYSILISVIAIYLCYHIVVGNRGILSLIKLEQGVKVIKSNIKKMKEEEKRIEHKIALIGDDDSYDLLEEKSIESGINPPNAIVVYK